MFALDEAFTGRHGARESVQKIMIVITDGRAQDNVELGDSRGSETMELILSYSKMLINAPKFFEIAKRIIEITEDCIIVAHNINFDHKILNICFSSKIYIF